MCSQYNLTMANSIPIAVRGSEGIAVHRGPPLYTTVSEFTPIISKTCRTIAFSPDGAYFVYVIDQSLHIVSTSTWSEVAVASGKKVYCIAFSPKGTYFMTWEPFAKTPTNPQGTPNVNIYKTGDGTLVKNFIYKKQSNWEPQWAADETLFAHMINTDIAFYENGDFNTVVHRMKAHKIASFSLSPTIGSFYVVCEVPGKAGQPSFGWLYKYPNFGDQQKIASKTFFQSDRVEFFWNSQGNSVLLLTTTEVDKTGKSYYGKQGLHFLGTKGETALVTFSKEGPIYNVEWSPKGLEFCVVYGFMPSSTTIFNLKCEPVFELGTGPRNSIYYNPHGNILLLGGFGNLTGQIEIWDVEKKKVIGKCEAPVTTLLKWSPDGAHFLTATTAPRLRISNGYKIWHYSGSLLHEQPWGKSEELYDVAWQKFPNGTFDEPKISNEKVQGIVSSQPQASKEAYRPPSARTNPVHYSFHDVEITPLPPSKQAKKRKKQKEKKVQAQEGASSEKQTSPQGNSGIEITLTGDPEKDKKLKNIKKKLDAITKLKEQQAEGKELQINQIAKINTEAELLQEFGELQL